MTRRAYVVLGDVVASREIDDREAFRGTLESTLAAVNERYADEVVGAFALVKGVDEIAGAIRDPRDLYRLVRDIVAAVRPGAIRFAVVYGEIDVGTSDDPVERMDGPAFHRADEALAEVADDDLYVAFDGRLPRLDTFVAASVNLLLMAREDWTDRQRAIVHAYEEAGTQAAVAERFDVSQQMVSATLRRADWPRLSRIEHAVNSALANYEPVAQGDGAQTERPPGAQTEVENGGS